jgi:hypothetical protein
VDINEKLHIYKLSINEKTLIEQNATSTVFLLNVIIESSRMIGNRA